LIDDKAQGPELEAITVLDSSSEDFGGRIMGDEDSMVGMQRFCEEVASLGKGPVGMYAQLGDSVWYQGRCR